METQLASDQAAQLRAENEALKAENAELKKRGAHEPAIAEKMAAGLTREQAISVIQQQADTDKFLQELEARQAKPRAK